MINPEVPEDDGRILEFHDIFGNFIFLFILVTNRKVKQNKSPNLRRVSQQNSATISVVNFKSRNFELIFVEAISIFKSLTI